MKKNKGTPVRAALKKDSILLEQVKDGLGAIETKHKSYMRMTFADSLDIDKAFLSEHAEENRWDYLLGHNQDGRNKVRGCRRLANLLGYYDEDNPLQNIEKRTIKAARIFRAGSDGTISGRFVGYPGKYGGTFLS